ncbi:MAG: hypothetical protein WC736_15245 [Gallionella sp.]|jgi:hypothetical protein
MTDWFKVQILAVIFGLYIIAGLCAVITCRHRIAGEALVKYAANARIGWERTK